MLTYVRPARISLRSESPLTVVVTVVAAVSVALPVATPAVWPLLNTAPAASGEFVIVGSKFRSAPAVLAVPDGNGPWMWPRVTFDVMQVNVAPDTGRPTVHPTTSEPMSSARPQPRLIAPATMTNSSRRFCDQQDSSCS